ncbi:MAG: LPS assembly lipoprotein LptE [Pseudorhodobacter sp.]
MSSSDRRGFLMLLPAAALVGCGFSPAYGPGGPGLKLQNAILADEPRDGFAFELVKRLEERLGPAQAARYGLSYDIGLKSTGVAITTANAITRYNLNGTADWVLRDLASGTRLTGGRAESFTSYSATGSTVAGLAAEGDAQRRLMRILADQIVTQLLATSGQWSGA